MLYPAYVIIIVASVCNVLSLQKDPPDNETFTSVMPPDNETFTSVMPPDNETFTSVMLRTVRRLCPTANICSNYTKSNSQLEKTSCCSDCSCDVNCSKNGDCCFPTEADTAAVRKQKEYQECIAPVTTDILPSGYMKKGFYYMTSSCPVDKDSSKNNDCGSVRVAPWGSLYPIYSKTTGKIYKNQACADCHGVRDGILWMAQLSCKTLHKSKKFFISVSEYFEELSQNLLSEYCEIYFTSRQTLDSEICFPDIIKTCKETEKEVSDISEMTRNEIVEACKNGIAAPFHHYYTYANVFCFLCNRGFQGGRCTGHNTGTLKPPMDMNKFTCILDTTLFEGVTGMDKIKDKYRPKACLNNGDQYQAADTCVDVLCPSGQIFDSNFKCFHPASIWRLPIYHIALRLKFDSLLINVSTLTTLLKSRSDVSTWMYVPWPKRWEINELYYEMEISSNRTNYVGSFLVFLKTRQHGKKHKSMLKEIKNYMTKIWKIKTLQEDISLTQHFLEYNTLHFSPYLNQHVPVWYRMIFRLGITDNIPFFRHNSIVPIIYPKEVLTVLGRINKMNFCKPYHLGPKSPTMKSLQIIRYCPSMEVSSSMGNLK